MRLKKAMQIAAQNGGYVYHHVVVQKRIRSGLRDIRIPNQETVRYKKSPILQIDYVDFDEILQDAMESIAGWKLGEQETFRLICVLITCSKRFRTENLSYPYIIITI